LARKLGQLQPFIAALPQYCTGPTGIFWANLRPFLACREDEKHARRLAGFRLQNQGWEGRVRRQENYGANPELSKSVGYDFRSDMHDPRVRQTPRDDMHTQANDVRPRSAFHRYDLCHPPVPPLRFVPSTSPVPPLRFVPSTSPAPPGPPYRLAAPPPPPPHRAACVAQVYKTVNLKNGHQSRWEDDPHGPGPPGAVKRP
jgi:hypothetical protein